MFMTNQSIAALILGSLLKNAIAAEIVSMLASGNVLPSLTKAYRIRVYGDTKAELLENRARCRDAAKVFGVALGNRPQFRDGTTIAAVPFDNDPFHQIKHYFAEVFVTYRE